MTASSWRPKPSPSLPSGSGKELGNWGHFALDILSMATFVPPPLMFVGVGAAASNAGWHAIKGDYLTSGTSLAIPVPGLAFTKLAEVDGVMKAGAVVIGAVIAARGSKVGNAFQNAAARADKVAGQAKVWLKELEVTTTEVAEAGAQNVTKATKAGYTTEKALQKDVAEKIPDSTMQGAFKTTCKGTSTGDRQVGVYDEKSGSRIEIKTGVSNPAYPLQEIRRGLILM